ncbi:cysteine protease, YopT-type domain protein, partial [Chlamydia psittaci C6/98]
YRRRSKHF